MPGIMHKVDFHALLTQTEYRCRCRMSQKECQSPHPLEVCMATTTTMVTSLQWPCSYVIHFYLIGSFGCNLFNPVESQQTWSDSIVSNSSEHSA